MFEFLHGGFFGVGQFGFEAESVLFEIVLLFGFEFEGFFEIVVLFVTVFKLVGKVGVAFFELLDDKLEGGGLLFEFVFLSGGVDLDGLEFFEQFLDFAFVDVL